MIWKLILIQIIIVFIVDISGVVDNIKEALWKWLHPKRAYQHYNLKPLDCSLCMTWWVSLIYILIMHSFTLPYIAAIAILSYLTTTTRDIIYLVKDIIDTTIMNIEKALEEND